MLTVYHGSNHIVKNPVYLGGKQDNDYGNGFYTTEYEDRAKSWAVLNGKPEKSVVNVYEINTEGLTILNFQDYGVLAWIVEVMANRGMSQEAAGIVGEKIVESYRLDSSRYDILTESSKSPTSNAQSIKWRVGTCLYQVRYKPHLINCEAVIRLWASSGADCEYPLDTDCAELSGYFFCYNCLHEK